MTHKTAIGMILVPVVAAAVLVLAVRSRAGTSEMTPISEDASAWKRAEQLESSVRNLESAKREREQLRQEIARMEKSREELKTKLLAPLSEDVPKDGRGESLGGALTQMLRKQIEGYAELLGDQLAERLDLDEESAEKIRALLMEEAKRGLEGMDKGDLKSIVQIQNFASMRDKLSPLLTPAQQAAFDRYLMEEKERMAAASVSYRANELATTLELTKEQKKNVKEVLKSNPAFVEMNDAEYWSTMNPEDMGRRIVDEEGIRSSRLRAALVPLLTPEQVVKLDEHLRQQEEVAKSMAEWVDAFSGE